jgi:Tfp pilus assembly PilM family ATPase
VVVARKHRSPIGIDVGSRNIKAVQLYSVGKGDYEIAALSIIPRTHIGSEIDVMETAVLKRVLKRQGFHGRRLVLGADEGKLLRGVFEVPQQASRAAVGQIVRMELARAYSVPPASFEMVCWEPLRADRPKSSGQAFALGYPHDAANPFLDAFEHAGFDVRAVDARSSAVARACRSLTLDTPAVTAILDLGWKSTRLLFVCGETIVYERMGDGNSISTLATELRDKFGIPEESAYQVLVSIGLTGFDTPTEFDHQSVEFIREKLDYYFTEMKKELKLPLSYISRQRGGTPVERMLLVGSGAMIPGVVSCIENDFELEVLTAAPVDLLPGPEYVQARGRDAALTVSCGLAMFEMD